MAFAVALLLTTAVWSALAVQPHSLHSDMAVLQSGLPCFSGTGTLGDNITVTIRHDSSGTAVAVAGPAAVTPNGRWKVCLTSALEPSMANHTILFTALPSGASASNIGVLIGNVIVCSGQSNMEKPTSYAFNATAEIAAAQSLRHAIRTVVVPGPWNHDVSGGAASSPQVDTKRPMQWGQVAAEWTPYGFSAICWMYGRRIYEAYPAVPLGLIESDVGGTNIQAWTPPEALATCGVAPSHFTPSSKISCPPYCNSSSLFNGMIAPLLNYAIHHVVWYQGESNCGDAKYSCMQQAMVSAWRGLWGHQFAFGFVELAGYGADNLPNEPFGSRVVAQLRMQQQMAATQLGVFDAVAMDLSDEAVMADLNVTTDVHSRFKEQVAKRLSLGGRAIAFGESDVAWKGPVAVRASLAQCGATSLEPTCVQVTFDEIGAGLLLLRPDLFEFGFRVNATSTSFWNATARLVSNDTVMVQVVPTVLDNRSGSAPIAIRYAQYNEPCNPVNDFPGMSPGGGGAPGPATKANTTAVLSCSLYAEYVAPGLDNVTLPARSFWLNVSSHYHSSKGWYP